MGKGLLGRHDHKLGLLLAKKRKEKIVNPDWVGLKMVWPGCCQTSRIPEWEQQPTLGDYTAGNMAMR